MPPYEDPEDVVDRISEKIKRVRKIALFTRLTYFMLGMFLAVLAVSKGGMYLAHKNDFVFAIFMVLTFGLGFKLIYSVNPFASYNSGGSWESHLSFMKKDYFKIGIATGIGLTLIAFLIYPFLPK